MGRSLSSLLGQQHTARFCRKLHKTGMVARGGGGGGLGVGKPQELLSPAMP